MAYFEFRKFNFFTLTPRVDSAKIADSLQGERITASSSGNGLIVIGDSLGRVHVVNKSYGVRTFKAYEQGISLMFQAKLKPILVTIGEEEMGFNPLIKVWSMEKNDKHGLPVLLRVTKAGIPNKVVVPSCLTVNNNLNLMALGFVDGSILLFRGDITRERTCKQKLLQNGLPSITGLSFCCNNEKKALLYVSTVSSVVMYTLLSKDQEVMEQLDVFGCSLGCSVLAEASSQDTESQFIVATNEVIYFYTNGVKGSCQIIGGEKLQLAWFRNYLVIVARETRRSSHITTASARSNEGGEGCQELIILDLKNKIMALSEESVAEGPLLVEWGNIYSVSPGPTSLSLLQELDLHSKLNLLFKKNLYDVGIRMAKDHHYDQDGLIDIFKQYGDYLYNKGDSKTAIEQYVKTIGYVEPSYIIKKYRESGKVEVLPMYLEALHSKGVASPHHTSLLLNCYTKLNRADLLREFILTKDKNVKFDVQAAMEVCRHVSIEDALVLAERYGYHQWYLAIQIEDQHKYDAALDYISQLELHQAEEMMKKYGTVLLKNIPDATTVFLQKLCTDYRPSNMPAVEQSIDTYKIQKADPVNYIHFFLNNSEKLAEFLSYIVQSGYKCTKQVCTTLMEHYLAVWATSPELRPQCQQRIMALLESRDTPPDPLQALVLATTASFTPGILHLFEQNKMYGAILRHHLNAGDFQSVLLTCRRLGSQEPRLWVHALWAVTVPAVCPKLPEVILEEILSVIDSNNLASPLEVVEALSRAAKIGPARQYLNSVFQSELNATEQDRQLVAQYSGRMDIINKTIEDIQFRPMIFQGAKCSVCDKQLCLPSVHFLCQHSFHQDCYQSYSPDDREECLKCASEMKVISEAIDAQDKRRGLAEDFHSLLDRSDDTFGLVTDYLGRGVFSQLSDLHQEALRAVKAVSVSPVPKRDDSSLPPYQKPIDLGSMRNTSDYVPTPGYDMDRKERPVVRSAPAPSRFLPQAKTSTNPFFEDPPQAAVPGNPFEDDSFDSPGNPFSKPTSTNPFDEDD